MPDASPTRPDRNLALELVRVTEAAALAAARLIGMGDKEAADQAAVDAMRVVLETVHMDGIVVIGEGEKDEAPMLYNGESIGDGSPPEVDIAVDPLEGTRLAAQGRPSALAVIALSPRGTMFDPGPVRLHGEDGRRQRRRRPARRSTGRWARRWALVAERRACDIRDIMVVVLDRPRHEERHPGHPRRRRARAPHHRRRRERLAARRSRDRSPVSLLWGIGGTPEGVISAAAIKAFGGAFIGRLWPRDDGERQAAIDAGYDLDRVLDQDELVRGDDCFFSATGVTDGDVLQGVRYEGTTATTESIVMRSRTGTVRRVSARHNRAEAARLHRRALRLEERRRGELDALGVQVERRARAVAPEAEAVGRGRQRAVGVRRRSA